MQSAIQTLTTAVAIAHSSNSLYIESYIRRELGLTLRMAGCTAEGQEMLEQALQQFTKLGIEQEIEKTQQALLSAITLSPAEIFNRATQS